jgi:hypothetical protein
MICLEKFDYSPLCLLIDFELFFRPSDVTGIEFNVYVPEKIDDDFSLESPISEESLESQFTEIAEKLSQAFSAMKLEYSNAINDFGASPRGEPGQTVQEKLEIANSAIATYRKQIETMKSIHNSSIERIEVFKRLTNKLKLELTKANTLLNMEQQKNAQMLEIASHLCDPCSEILHSICSPE